MDTNLVVADESRTDKTICLAVTPSLCLLYTSLYRSFGDLDKDIKKHELVAVETGKNIDDVADALSKAAADDQMCIRDSFKVL